MKKKFYFKNYRINTKDFLFGDVLFYKKALTIALPVMGQLLIQTLVVLVDNFMVAGLGDVKMSGVNVSNQLVFVLIVLATALSTAGGMFMSQYSGAKDSDGMKQVFSFKILTMVFLAGLAMVFILLIPEKLMGLMVDGNLNSKEIISEGKIYLLIISFAFIPGAIATAFSSSLREIGNVKPPLYISTIASLLNVVGNYILIYGNFGAPRLEVAGAAYSTLFARGCELLAFIIYAKKTQAPFYVKLTRIFKIKFNLFKEIFRRSAWLFISEFSWVITETIINAVYNKRGGSEVVAGMSAGWTISELFFLTYTGIEISIAVIIGGLLGQDKLDEARQKAKWLRSGAFIIGIGNGIVQAISVLIFIPLFYGRLSSDAQIVARNLLWVVALYMPIWTYQHSQYATLRAGGDAFTTAWIETIINLLFFIPAIYIVRDFTTLGAVAMYGVVKLGSIIKPSLSGIVIHKGRWLKNLTDLKKE